MAESLHGLSAAPGPDVVLGRPGDRGPLRCAMPVVGPDLALLIRGDYVVGDATLDASSVST